MFKTLRATALAACALTAFAAAPAMAQTISQTTRTSSFGFDNSQARFAQIVTAPNTRLTTFSVEIDGAGPGTVTPQVFASTGGNLTGAALYTGTPFTPTPGAATYTFTTGGVPVTSGSQYALVFTATGTVGGFPFASGDVLPGSDLRFAASSTATTLVSASPGADAKFSVTFDAAPPPATVPTLSEWAMIGLGLSLAGGAVLMIQRRRRFA